MERQSLHVNYTSEDVAQLAKEVKDETIAAVNLSLFAWWIGECEEHYKEAKQHIRELGLDQEYPTHRIRNTAVRKLLDETKDIRTKYASTKLLTDEPLVQQPLIRRRSVTVASLLSRSKLSNWLPANEAPVIPRRSLSNVVKSRVANFTSPMTGNIQTPQSYTSSSQPQALMSPRQESLPPTLKKKKDLTINTALSSCFVSPADRRFPPNTPDRPQPLNLRCRTTGSALSRSVSTPVHGSQSALPIEVVQTGVHNSVSQPPLSSPLQIPNQFSKRSDTSRDDVFGRTRGSEEYAHNRLASPQNLGDETRNTSEDVENYRMQLSSLRNVPPLALDATTELAQLLQDAGYSNSDDGFSEAETQIVQNQETRQSMPQKSLSLNGSVDTNSRWTTTASEISPQLDRVDHEYKLPNPPVGNPVSLNPAPTPSQRRSGVLARRAAARGPQAPSQFINDVERPLPLRVDHRNLNRSNTISSTSENSNQPYRPRSRSWSTVSQLQEDSDESRDQHPTVPSATQLNRNLVKTTPVTGNVALGLPPLHHLTIAYRAITSEFVAETLSHFREQGIQMPTVKPDSLTNTEKDWRETNEALLVIIYGRHDVVLTEQDVQMIDRIAKEMRMDEGSSVNGEWLRSLFR